MLLPLCLLSVSATNAYAFYLTSSSVRVGAERGRLALTDERGELRDEMGGQRCGGMGEWLHA